MKKSLSAVLLGLAVLSGMFAAAGSVHATLGEYADSLESDRKALSAVRGSMTAHNNYTVREFDSDSTSVREYMSLSGIVFGIAWNGLIHPDLDQLLGSYDGEYRRALQQTPRMPGQRRILLKTSRIVVEKWGHMRNLQGRAYDPALIPSGVGVDEIR
jgi:hypothetical protein